MAAGDHTLTNYGSLSVSGATLKTMVDAVSMTPTQYISGSQLHLIPIGNGQVQLIKVEVSG